MTDEPTFDIPFYPKFIITLRLTLGVEHPMDLDKCIMTCIYHSIKQNSFTAPASPLCASCSNFPFELFWNKYHRWFLSIRSILWKKFRNLIFVPSQKNEWTHRRKARSPYTNFLKVSFLKLDSFLCKILNKNYNYNSLEHFDLYSNATTIKINFVIHL